MASQAPRWRHQPNATAPSPDACLPVCLCTCLPACTQVGGEVARRARGLGMKVVAYDPYASAEKAAAVGVTLVTFDEALSMADFFSLHMPLTPGTKHMFNDAAFAKMKKGARIANVARGGVIEDEALARALDAGIVAAAALDVFEEEPPAFEGHPLIGR
jgi:D-3-phosphoglycerate dehydrogenase